MSVRVAISNGFGQFHLRGLAERFEESGELTQFITGALPPSWVSQPAPWGRFAPLRRLNERGVAVGPSRLTAAVAAEIPHQFSQLMRSRGHHGFADAAATVSMGMYQATVSRAMRKWAGHTDIYHTRAGYGGRSIARARRWGMAVVCDHSIAAPGVIDRYIPQAPPTRHMPRLWRRMQSDIDAADVVLVNSDFVASTLEESGTDRSRIAVAYTPVDEVVASYMDAAPLSREHGRPLITFAGTAEQRKGIDVFARVAEAVGPVARWQIIGGWGSDAIEIRRRMPSFVEIVPKLPRLDLALALRQTDVFLFPSRAEGSARVVAEALRAGTWVVTSRMSGSATRDNVDGRVLDQAEDIDGFVRAVREAISRTPELVARQAERTRLYAAERLSMSRYVEGVLAAYALADERR